MNREQFKVPMLANGYAFNLPIYMSAVEQDAFVVDQGEEKMECYDDFIIQDGFLELYKST